MPRSIKLVSRGLLGAFYRALTWETWCPRGDLNTETGEISLITGLNSKTGEKSPDRGSHAGEPIPAGPPPLVIPEAPPGRTERACGYSQRSLPG